jgi:glycosyltransferase involved in cell wall biosynthesis
MRAAVALVTGFLVAKLATLVANVVRFPVLRAAPGSGAKGAAMQGPAAPRVSLLIPVRNEAQTLRRLLPAMLQQRSVTEIIVLDDCSTDESAQVLRTVVRDHARARLVTGAPLRPGWVGKTWACHQLAQHATGSILLFCDADVVLSDGAIGAVLAEMVEQHADVFSVFPRQVTGSLTEHLVTPLIDDVLLCFLPFGLLSMDVPAAATANGSLIAFTRTAYDALGGFAAVRKEIVEDLAIARRTRAAGLKLGLALGGELVETRMYSGYRDVVQGLGRGVLPALGGSRLALAVAAGWHLFAYTYPGCVAWRDRRWLVPLAFGLTERIIVELKAGRGTAWRAALTPLCPVAFLPIAAQAMRAEQRWKGRSYR